MDKDIKEILEKIANKLGTSVEKLWEALIAQADIESRIHRVWMYAFIGMGIAGGFIFVLCAICFYNQFPEDPHYLEFPLGLSGFIAFIASVCFFGNALPHSMEAMSIKSNPTYWALNEILNYIN